MQNKYYYFRILSIAGLLFTLVFSSCKKDDYYTKEDASLEFSQSIITFDTIFSTIGTITKKFTVHNPHKNTIKTNIALIGGNSSYFSVNVDGVSGTSFTDVEIPAKDSIFIFVKANINPNGVNGPILHVDELTFFTNGNRQKVELLACAEDAHFIIPDRELKLKDGVIPYKIVANVNEDITWTKDKPYVIYGYAVVDSAAKLTIEEGTQIYIHKDGALWVYIDGCLHVNGTKDSPVVFQGDRRSSAPKYDYAQWDKIWINEGSRDNIINYAVIKNARVGIYAETLEQYLGNKLLLTNSIINCSEQYGFMGRNYKVEGYNNVISDCGEICLALQGGYYTFINNTFYNQYAYSRQTPAVYFSNYYETTTEKVYGDFYCDFFNNIVYGNSTKELTYYNVGEGVTFSAQIENCLIRTETKYLSGLTYSDCILNENPLVKNVKEYDFSLQDNSPCKGKGKSIPIMELDADITGTIRGNPPSIGAYE
jgi:hypothetical protein